MKRSLLLLPLGLVLASSVGRAQITNIPLPPPTPLNPDAMGQTGTGAASTKMEMVAKKKAAEYTDEELRALGTGITFPYELLDSVLHRFVSDKGEMYYLKVKDDNDLNTFVRALAVTDLNGFPMFTKLKDPEDATKGLVPDMSYELMFWINAYNGLRIKAISDRYPVSSIVGLKDFDTEKTHVIAGKNYSFAELRQKIGKMDPRALFGMVYGTVDGPSTPISVFRASGLNQQLDLAAKSFVNDPSKVGVPDRLANKVEVSPFLQEVNTYFQPGTSRRKFEGIHQVLATYSTNGAARNYFVTADYTINFSLANNKLNEQINR